MITEGGCLILELLQKEHLAEGMMTLMQTMLAFYVCLQYSSIASAGNPTVEETWCQFHIEQAVNAVQGLENTSAFSRGNSAIRQMVLGQKTLHKVMFASIGTQPIIWSLDSPL